MATANISSQPNQQQQQQQQEKDDVIPWLSDPEFEENSISSFTWIIRDVRLLRDDVEASSPPSGDDMSASMDTRKCPVWKKTPTFGNGWWKVSLLPSERTVAASPSSSSSPPPQQETQGSSDQQPSSPNQNPQDSTPNNASASATRADSFASNRDHPQGSQNDGQSSKVSTPSPTIAKFISIRLTAQMRLMKGISELPARVMVGIRPARPTLGTHGGYLNSGWIWRRFYQHTFDRHADHLLCNGLPSLSQLLETPAIANDDAFALNIQVFEGLAFTSQDDVGPSFMPPFETQTSRPVQRSVIESLHGLLNDANTGVVRIVVRERGLAIVGPAAEDMAGTGVAGFHQDQIIVNPLGSVVQVDPQSKTVVRDRVLWAHSSVLKSRSDYFRTMLTSVFREGVSKPNHVCTLRIPNTDFVTAYWFLRYLYTEEIEFAEVQDVGSIVLDEEWAKMVRHTDNKTSPIWQWTSTSQVTQATGASASADSIDTDTVTTSRLEEDPHHHPTPVPPPASALAIFKLAYYYNLEALFQLASIHLVSTLTPASAFPLLIATSVYQDLHAKVKSYVHHRWQLVSNTPEFVRCWYEVCDGKWGVDAGKVLGLFIKGLVSPVDLGSSGRSLP